MINLQTFHSSQLEKIVETSQLNDVTSWKRIHDHAAYHSVLIFMKNG